MRLSAVRATLTRMPTSRVRVYFDAGRSRVFACSLDWPGWCRRAKSDEDALEALATYLPRYARVAERAGVPFPAAGEAASKLDFEVVERIPPPAQGFSAADFGALGDACSLDAEPLGAAEAKRIAALVEAAWAELDAVSATAPAELRKGPRGGGRDRDKVVDHVLGAEASYARKLGVRHRQPERDDRAAIQALRSDILAVLRAARAGEAPVEKGWTPRYAARRIAWHVLDHAWEIEDRSAD